MKFLKVMPLLGPNIWTYRPVLEAWVDIGALEDSPSNTIPGFYERLTSWLPNLIEHRCGVGERGGFLLRLREGTWPGHILEHVTIELQNLAGMQTGFGKARETSTRGVYKVVVRSRDATVSRACMEAARDLVMAAIEDRPFDVPGAVSRLRELADSLCLGPSTACIVEAAAERKIPFIRLNEGNLVQLGYGAKQHRIWTAETDQTSAISESIASDKDLTKTMLQSCGVPVPEGRVVESPEDAWDAAQDIDGPVVVKPTDANHGRGVTTELTRREEIETAYKLALNEGSEVMVERYVRGNEHRLLVVGGKVVAAARGESISIVGDGQSSIAQLIDSQLNTDPRRGDTEAEPLELINLEKDQAIQFEIRRQGYQPESVPAQDVQVLIQRNGNVAIDVTDEVHPTVAAAAELAVRVIGLDIAGVDMVIEDVSKPIAPQRGAIVEVNAGPGLLMHLKPAVGTPRPVGEAISGWLFPQHESGRIPLVGISGTRGKSTVGKLLARLLHLNGKYVGLTSNDGLYLDQRQVEKGDRSNWPAAHKVLLNRSVDAAVLVNNTASILSEGIAYDRCQVGVVTNIMDADGLDTFYIHDTEQVYNVLRTQIDIVLPDGVAVLNAADPLVLRMAELCDGSVTLFAVDPDLAAIAEHRKQGGRAVFVRNGYVVMAGGKDEVGLVEIAAVPILADGKRPYQVENVLAAVGAAWALDLPADLIRAGIETYKAAY